tara:strand:+ start:23099 stop:23305 length:207 start_codon:yes stop_codon:yes gene_type:complete
MVRDVPVVCLKIYCVIKNNYAQIKAAIVAKKQNENDISQRSSVEFEIKEQQSMALSCNLRPEIPTNLI